VPNLLARPASQMLFRVVVIEPERGCVRSYRTSKTRRSDGLCVYVGQTMSRAGNRSARAVTVRIMCLRSARCLTAAGDPAGEPLHRMCRDARIDTSTYLSLGF
jgi:hypothetical protein